MLITVFEYHTFLHHSQTLIGQLREEDSLSTIHFYIILKPAAMVAGAAGSLSTIHFYIILKLPCRSLWHCVRLSTIHFYIILKLSAADSDVQKV